MVEIFDNLTILKTLFIIFVIFLVIFICRCQIIEPLTPNNNSEYKDYNTDGNNSTILIQQNSGNIQYLKEQMEDVTKMKNQISSMDSKIDQLQQQVKLIYG